MGYNKTSGRSRWAFAWAPGWSTFTLLAAALSGYRIVATSQLVKMMEPDDLPALRFLTENLPVIAWGVIICSGFCLLSCGMLFRKLSTSWVGLGLWVSMAMCGMLSGGDAIWALADRTGFDLVPPESLLDWIRILTFPATGCFFLIMVGGRNWETDEQINRGSPWSYALVFILGASSAFVYALVDHFAFWRPSLNGGHDYGRFFAEGETGTTNLVLYSTSLLFASMVGVIAVACRATYRLFCLRESGWTGRHFSVQSRQSLAVVVLWTLSASCPWMLKLWPEISSERAWILLPAAMGFCFSFFVGPVGMTNKLIGKDELRKGQNPGPNGGGSERMFLSTTLFFVYPLLRLLPAKNPNRRRIWLLWMGAVSATTMTWLAHEATNIFSFEDWRGMLKKCQLPYLRILGSVLIAYAIYLWCRRGWPAISLCESGNQQPLVKKCRWWRRATLTAALLVILGGSWPLWGWGRVPENVFARVAEFSSRHRFELLVLHWLCDSDGDGYASILHGADPDDENPSLLAGGMAAVGPTIAQEDVFHVDNAHSLKNFPSVVLLFLEGVTPDAISAYGKRQLSGGAKATPHIDQIASDGTLFTNARVTYPSTWDTWYATLSGRMVRVMEMTSRWKFGDRYSKLNNLSKILDKAGVGVGARCYPDAAGFTKLFLSEEERLANLKHSIDTTLNSKDRLAGLKRGDKRLIRMRDFIDGLEEDERFFLCEHMADTHFPWNRTTIEKAKQLGFPNGLEFAEEGGKTDQQKRYFQAISRMDGQIGELMRRLKERRLYEQTCVIVVGDHGCQWNEHEHGYYVSHLYDPSIRIPFIIKLPKGRGREGLHADAPVVPQDILSTLGEMAGLSHNPNKALGPLFGNSLLPILDGREKNEAVNKRQSRDLLLITHYDKVGLLYGSRWKLIFDRPLGNYRLFDLQKDPDEMLNLADAEKDGMMKIMKKRLCEMAWRHRTFIGGIRWKNEINPNQRNN